MPISFSNTVIYWASNKNSPIRLRHCGRLLSTASRCKYGLIRADLGGEWQIPTCCKFCPTGRNRFWVWTQPRGDKEKHASSPELIDPLAPWARQEKSNSADNKNVKEKKFSPVSLRKMANYSIILSPIKKVASFDGRSVNIFKKGWDKNPLILKRIFSSYFAN